MGATRVIVARVTREQHLRVRNTAAAKGFKTIAQYIRSLALENDSVYERKLDEIYRVIVPTITSIPKKKEKTLLAFLRN